MRKIVLLLTIVFLIVAGCSNTKSGYDDGKYCAGVDYHNPKTGTNSHYTLTVRIEDNKLTVLYWPNGGWSDNSEFAPVDISTGRASFETYDGKEYTVDILGTEGNCN